MTCARSCGRSLGLQLWVQPSACQKHKLWWNSHQGSHPALFPSSLPFLFSPFHRHFVMHGSSNSIAAFLLVCYSSEVVKVPTGMAVVSASPLYMTSVCQVLLNATNMLQALNENVTGTLFTQTLEKFRTPTYFRKTLNERYMSVNNALCYILDRHTTDVAQVFTQTLPKR